MKTPHPLAGWLTLLALLSTLNSQLSTSYAQGTAFTYQGRLSDGTDAANGIYDLRFGLHDLSAGGHLIAGPLTNAATPVSNGLFTVTLDFGPGVFAGDACWLGMGVRTNGGTSFTTLTPRQQLTATPYAILASGVGVGDITADMLASGAVTTDKIATGAVKEYQIDDSGSAAYEGFQSTVQAIGGEASLPFASLYSVPATNGVTPAFSLNVNGAAFGTVVGFSGSEGISRPYAYVVEARYTGAALDTEAQLGRPASLTFTRNNRTTTFGGIITACAVSGASGTSRLYTVRIESPLAHLALTTDYRINQDTTAHEVAANLYRAITTNLPISGLTGNYYQHANLVQYAETDLNFFSRLLENEGIFYFFDQSATPPALTVGDSASAFLAAPNSPFAYYGDTATNVPAAGECIRTFQKAHHQSTQRSTVNAYNFQTPSANLEGHTTGSGVGEQYEFAKSGIDASYYVQLAQVRQERQTAERAAIAGSGTAPDLRAGYRFALADYAGVGVEGSYVVTEVRHAGFVRVTNGVSKLFYGNQFQVIPTSLTYRPALRTPKPQAQPCTAVVTGPASEEIWTDQYGRVKVQFHWDRYGVKDQNSSAWLRQTSPMASSDFRGMMFLPRIGDEVLVSFIQGDPDQPVITGSLYNGINMPPYNLPGSKTVSTIRSTGSKGQPSQVNEIKFDDLAGNQEFNLQAAKDMNVDVANDLIVSASHNLVINAAVNLEITASKDLTINVASNLTVQANAQTTFSGPLAASSLAIQTGSASNLTLTGNLYLPNTTAGAGAIHFGNVPVIRAFAGGNFFAGANAGNATMSGNFNTAVGAGALDADTTGANNTAYGYGALGTTTSGNENTASGVNALLLNVNGNQNTAQGGAALYKNTSGSANTASGYMALFSNTNGWNNTAHGYHALINNTSGSNNTALGYQAGYNLTTGNNNVHVGNTGTAADNGVIRLGTPGTHNTTYLAGTIQASSNLFMNDRDVQLRSDGLHGLGWYGSSKLFAGVNVNGPVLYGGGGGALGAINGTTTNIALSWDNARNVGIGGMLLLSSNVFLNDKNLYLRGDFNHGVGWYGSGKLFAGTGLDGPVLFGYSGGGLGTMQTGTATNLAVYWNAAGNVGIGTNSPAQKLVVAGNIYATGTITPNSDRDQKTDFTPVDAAAVLAKVAALPIQQWRFKAEDTSVKHVGPMAQDFRTAFGLGEIPTAIATVDADGVALAAIQGLNRKLEETRAENAALKARLDKLEQLLSAKIGGGQ